ncbi:uncharacterized protein BO95DRAFT_517751 [Aspergillus brunneoviolaceus CBS 621.78]|uniref:Uncharacterized protein n=1 Tax=Aspergillus brunneoviolaceus CBS 621.78 TaxID=1450534 RepID=A0ACD1FXL2_9EURO|nr:hypothetical protein BO95DRAFT_517751 [Aspergillus brunneoviolaceus CBS 621.78]RAH41704.1 hypothetical protein BO95DRAFT_517751 [Aspergillus brunneoviolaceus CBS 621.78]
MATSTQLSTSPIAQHSDLESQNLVLETREGEQSAIGVVSDQQPAQPEDGVPVDANSEALHGAIKPDLSAETFSEEVLDAIKKLHKGWDDYVKHDMNGKSLSHDNITYSTRILRLYERSMSLGSRVAQSDFLSFMIQSYFRLVDDRLFALERGIATQKGSPNAGEEEMCQKTDKGDEAERAFSEATIPNKNPVLWRDFKRKEEQEKISNVHAIDVLIGEVVIPHNIWPNFHARNTLYDNETPKDAPITANASQLAAGDYTSMPDRIRINGTSLQKLLEKVLDLELYKEGSPIVLLKPYKILAQHEKTIRGVHAQLRRKFGPTPTGRTVPDLDFEPESRQLSSVSPRRELSRRGRREDALEKGSVERIFYSDLWHIFNPGQVVITRQEPLHAYRVLYVTAGRPYLSPPALEGDDSGDGYKVPAKESDLLVHCYQIQFDGQRFGPVTHTFNIQPYSGRLRVKDLPIYPLQFVEDPKVLKETLVSSGRKFLRVSKGTHLQYSGPNLHEGEELDSEVIVDFQTAIWDNRDEDPIGIIKIKDFIAQNKLLTTDTRYLDDNPENVPEEDLILFPNRVFAFVLKDRKWAVIDLNYVDLDAGADKPKDRGWNSLVLPLGHKKMVQSLVQAHFRHRREEALDRNSQADLIRGKSKGLIILLHGAPGVGKTSTAECVAELCNLPLYLITCGDLGITATDVESRLKYIFTQAQKWKCVLLLDEADVFLSQRETNVKHNSLVSVFLRVLDYYQGILFLTTNRVGKIDEAFRSRVHISLYYPPLDKSSTQKIFTENMNLAEKRGKSVIRVNRDEIRDFAREHYRSNDPQRRWNGRQICNAFHIAIAIAEDRAAEKNAKAAAEGKERRHTPVLKAEYLRMVEAASTRFDDYLHTVHGMGQQDLAKQGSARRDDWEEDRDRRDNRKYQSSRAADSRRRKVEESSETSMTESSEAESHKHTSSEKDSDDDSQGGRKEEVEPSSSDEEPSLRESRKRSDRKKGSQTKERKNEPGETRKNGTRSSRKNRDSR